MTKQEFLELYPWKEQRLQGRKPVEYFFSIPLSVTAEEIWPYISDTSTLNEGLGLARITFTEKEGRLYGQNTLAGRLQEWEEVPWSWEYGTSLHNQRVYTAGFMHYIRGDFHLERLEDGTTEFSVYFGYVPSSLFARLFLEATRKRFTRRFFGVMKNFEAEVLEKRRPRPASGAAQGVMGAMVKAVGGDRRDASLERKKIDAIRERMRDIEEIDQSIVDLLFEYVAAAPDNSLYRMRPKGLAERFGVDSEKLILVMLHATRQGLINMSWDVICPHCQGIRERADHLWDVNEQSSCDICEIDFSTSSINALEISFHISPYVKDIERVFYCAAEPAKKPHIKMQHALGPGEEFAFSLPREPGRYRLRVKGRTRFGFLDVGKEYDVSEIQWSGDPGGVNYDAAPGARVRVLNTEEAERTFIMEENAEDRYALRPRDLFNIQGFRDLFAEETLSSDLSLDVGVQNIVFVDIVKSSEMYAKIGDSKAFKLVRDFFKTSHTIAQRYRGAIVKTMGDAVLMAFSNPVDALRSSAAFMTYFSDRNENSPIRTRISINRGSCLAVRLNSFIDYFGQPVNTVAKLQSFAGAGETVLARDFVRNGEVNRFLVSRGFKLETRREEHLPGIGATSFWVVRLKMKDDVIEQLSPASV